MTRKLSLTVNGRSIEAVVEPRTHLADFIRDVLRLTGTHLGCEHGVCGACTVLVDGAPTRSCIAYAIACDGTDVRTIEGFDDDCEMRALRHAFTGHHALQCGYCTPGMLITAHDIIRRLPGADEARVREELSGNLCRCTGYVGIVEAVRSVLANPPARGDGLNGSVARSPAPPSDTENQSTTPWPDLPAPPSGSGFGDEARNPTMRAPEAAPRTDTSSPASRISDSARGTANVTYADSTNTTSGADSSPRMSAQDSSDVSNTAGSEHEITFSIAPDSLWRVLRDVATVVRCIPGASLTGPPNADPLSLDMTVAVGPMRARFEGTARVAFADRRHTATIDGSGHDARSRSTSRGRIELSVRPSAAGGSILLLRLHYALKGPLAQFSRGAVVDTVVEQLLERFAANLVSAAGGKEADSLPPLGGLGLAAAAFRRWLRRWLTRSDH